MLTWLAEFMRDVRFGVRHLAKSPGITSIAVLSLALGIMATMAIYSVIHAVVLDPFPYAVGLDSTVFAAERLRLRDEQPRPPPPAGPEQ